MCVCILKQWHSNVYTVHNMLIIALCVLTKILQYLLRSLNIL